MKVMFDEVPFGFFVVFIVFFFLLLYNENLPNMLKKMQNENILKFSSLHHMMI